MLVLVIGFFFLFFIIYPFFHKATKCVVHVYFGHHHNNSM